MDEATIQEVLESLESKAGAFDMHWSQAPTDHEVFDDLLVVLVEHTTYSDRSGGCEYGCSLSIYDSSADLIGSTEKYVWRHRNDPHKDEPRNSFLEILSLGCDYAENLRVVVKTPEGERTLRIDSEG